ncbi:hypothetical protein AVEN_158509-1 [Araneus ventricosus]|uniref:Uncharacterized protein n=1 Tax=Araneus ventricosus TaxID=182803 RepID=A0A4Y2JGJ1_ARAVE|nr:hypothetical protein AVEN_158509-1 [Araneus ventricosus]
MGTGYRTGNPFRDGRSSLKFVRLVLLASNWKESATAAKLRRRMIYSFCRRKLAPRKSIKPRLPSDSSYSKWIFSNITSCYRDRHQLDNLADRQYISLIKEKTHPPASFISFLFW